MKAAILIIVLAVFSVIGITLFSHKNFQSSQPTPLVSQSKSEMNKDQPKQEILVTNLEVPWAITFIGGNNLLVNERKGDVRLIENNKLLENPLSTINIKQIGESGLHGIAIHPKFNDNQFIFLYYTYSGNGNDTLNRVSRFKLNDTTLIDEKIIVDKIPGAIFHDGGRIKFGPDGYLYITTGDALNPSSAQDKNSLSGKILRVTDEGKPAPGNPFNNEVYSFGHRNPQGITWDNQGRLWETEHGQSTQDEINLIEMGKNYGWPTIRGDEKQEGMVTPILHSGSDTWAPAGVTFFNGSLFYGGLRGTALYQLYIGTKQLKTHFKGEYGRIRDVILGPDNMLYITTSNKDGRGSPDSSDDRIIKINPALL